MLTIVVFAFDRPRYLYVTLSSIFSMRGIEQHKVFVFVDGGLNKKIREAQAEVLSNFPVFTFFRDQNLKILGNITQGLYQTFSLGIGINEIVYFEDDFIIVPNTLEIIKRFPREGIFLSLCALPEQSEFAFRYRPMGNVISKVNFAFLYDWVINKRYIGLQRPRMDEILTEGCYSHDAVYGAFLFYHRLKTKFIRIPLVAHFGIRGMHSGVPLDDPDLLETEARMFAGDRSNWLYNILDILKNRDFPKKFDHRFLPQKGFNYSHFD